MSVKLSRDGETQLDLEARPPDHGAKIRAPGSEHPGPPGARRLDRRSIEQNVLRTLRHLTGCTYTGAHAALSVCKHRQLRIERDSYLKAWAKPPSRRRIERDHLRTLKPILI